MESNNSKIIQKKIKTTITYDIDIKIRLIKDDIYMYRVRIISSGEENIIKNKTGLCLKSEINKLEEYPRSFKSKLDRYNLYEKSIKDFIKYNIQNDYDFLKLYMMNIKAIIDDEEFMSDDYIIMTIDSYTDNYYEYGNNIPLIKPIHFDYTSGNIDNEHYNLEELKKILENRKDIKIEYKEKCNKIIQDIPYYNSTKDRNEYISFYWIAKDKDWEKYCKSYYFNKLLRYDYIIENILNNEDYKKITLSKE